MLNQSVSTIKIICILATTPPFGSNSARDALEMAMLCGTFGYQTRLIFLADAVFTLLKEQDGQNIQQKNTGAMVAALPLYEVNTVIVCANDLAIRNIQPNELVLPVQVQDNEAISQQINTSDIVFTI